MSKTKLNIAGLLKEFLIERNTSSVIVNDLYIQLKGLSIDYLKKKGIKKDIENIAEDIRGEVIDKILESAHKEFWKDNLGSKKVNDKIINSYVYTIIRECYRNVTENFSNGESDLLYKAINIIFEELVNKGLLYQINNEYYSRNNIKECTEYYENSLDIYYIDIRRGKKKEQLDHSILKEFITKIITDLENYCFTLSDITRTVSHNSNYGNMVEFRVNRFDIRDTEISETEDNLMILVSEDENIVVNDKVINAWINDFKIIYDEDERLENALIILFFFDNVTLVKISKYLSDNNISYISKSSIKNRIDKTLTGIGFFEIKNSGDEKKHYLRNFLNKLIKEFIPAEYIEELKKIKMEELEDG